jgi:hypothetical protein
MVRPGLRKIPQNASKVLFLEHGKTLSYHLPITGLGDKINIHIKIGVKRKEYSQEETTQI